MNGQKIFVGLSGGVDSAVSAALLKEQGHDVVGAYIKIWQPEFIECTWREDRLDAMRVCAALDIPFREVDLSDEYKKSVVDAMVRDYARGITPNPDVLCNRKIKFGAFAQWAFANGADLIATGHYARTDNKKLLRARDTAKDQSYFLYQTPPVALANTLFPVGGMLKAEGRDAAKRFGLPNAQKPDSQGLCFVGEVSMRDFLARFIAVERGVVVDLNGNGIGHHEGAALYTVGQRHGFSTDSEGPYYVVGIDVSTNTVCVSPRREDAAKKSVRLQEVQWINDGPTLPAHVSVQARYHETPVQAIVDGSTVDFELPHIVSAGQSLVMYKRDVCLGGGVISQ